MANRSWLDVAELGDTARERYEDLIRLYVLPTFGDVLAAKLDTEVLERSYARLQRCREMCGGRARNGHTCRALANNTTRKVNYVLPRSARTRRPLAAPRRERGSPRGAACTARTPRTIQSAVRARPPRRRGRRTYAELTSLAVMSAAVSPW